MFAVQGGSRPEGVPLGADNAAPAGARALVEVLRDHGVEVVPVDSLDDALTAAEARESTVLLHDVGLVLDDERRERLAEVDADLVVVDPTVGALADLAPGVRLAGTADGPLQDAGCEFSPAVQAGELPDGLATLSLDAEAEAEADGWTTCFADADDRAAVATMLGSDGRRSVVPSTELFANESIDRDGSAALAIGMLGAHERLVWYQPGLDDADAAAAPTTSELAPDWVSPVVILLIVTTVAAAIVAGRRFGPLVVEPLPVEVPAAETSLGRARLYERSGGRTHALDQLRMGAIGRLAGLLRLGRRATVAEVVGSAAAATGRAPAEIEALLVARAPQSDTEFAELARAIDALEAEVRRATRPDDVRRSTAPRPDPNPSQEDRR
nr:DUF4350 domain-containing protein [Agromyces seonyuensis]